MNEFFGNPFANSIILLILSILLGAVVSWMFKTKANARDEVIRAEERLRQEKVEIAAGHVALQKEVADLKDRLSLVSAQVVPFSTAFQQILVAQLTHSHTPRLDWLLKKIGPPITLTADEEKEMYDLLAIRQTELNGLIDQEEREAALILPYVMRRARAEQENATTLDNLRVQKLLVDGTVLVAVPINAIYTDNP